ncbi:type II toxin-antitoxin system VapC family toxin [bacterium]|nr:type II toxin-antitoxin system VapC family toxin [bacterium]
MADAKNKVRAFVDANVLFAGAAFPRWPYEVLRHAAAGDFRLVLSPLVIKQARRNLEKRFSEYIDRFEAFVQSIDYELVADPTLEEVEANKNIIRDFSDVPVALSAISAKVEYMVSEDKDFTTQDETTAELRRHFKIMLSGTFLREVMGWTSEQLESVRHRKWSDISEKEDRV